jgi:hypothetical protein
MNGPPVCHFIPASIRFWEVVGNREVIAELSFLEGESSLAEQDSASLAVQKTGFRRLAGLISTSRLVFTDGAVAIAGSA